MKTWALAASVAVFSAVLLSQQPATGPVADRDREEFLLKAKVLGSRPVSTGINNTQRVTLALGGFTHDAHFNDVNFAASSYQTPNGTELNFKDNYKFNLVAYKLDRLIGLNMIPVYVERKVNGKSGALGWWVDDVLMMELNRHQKKMEPPDQDGWNDQMYQVRIFNELAYNVDANLGNLLITRDWNIVMVDFTRAFRLHKTLRAPKNLVRIDNRVYEGLKKLNAGDVQREAGNYLHKGEIQAVMARRDRIIEFFDREIAAKGEAAVKCTAPGH
ncbi:MAG: hypothetical protein FJW20_01600 [Acidimicrobiia bacterium]|nr:hypothetical protein [Acidimicrobiia bacterium]